MTLGRILRNARQAKGISQLALSFMLDVSQRHVSYLESDRARASRGLIFAWMKAVDAPIEMRNAALHHSGFSCEKGAFLPPYDTSLDSTQVKLFRSAAIPFPILIFNSNWLLLDANPAAKWLAILTMPKLWLRSANTGACMSMIDALIAPDGLLLHMENGRQFAASFLLQIEQESWTNQSLVGEVEKFSALVARRYGVNSTDDGHGKKSADPLTIVLNTPHGTLTFFPIQATLGHTQGITLQSLRIAHWFPGDARTQMVLRTHAHTFPIALSLPSHATPEQL